jgi:iron complex outermembrane receptor protein
VEQKMAGYDAQATTPMLGIGPSPGGHLSLYANYIEGLSAGTTVAAGYANAGETLKPYQTQQMEAGVKWQNAGLTHTFSLFQISKPSAISVTRVGTPPTLVDDDGEQRGAEWTVSGKLASAWTLLGGVAYTQAKQTKTQGGSKDGLGHVWRAALDGESGGRLCRGRRAGAGGQRPHGLHRYAVGQLQQHHPGAQLDAF